MFFSLAGAIQAQSAGNQSGRSNSAAGPETRISGTVTDQTGTVIPGTEVVAIANDGQTYRTTTGFDGRFELAVPIGNYRIEVTAIGFIRLRLTDFSVTKNTQKPITAVLEPETIICELPYFGQIDPIPVEEPSVSSDINPRLPATTDRRGTSSYKLTGRITDSEGAAISNLRVSAVSKTGETTQTITNLEGDYQLVLGAGEYVLTIEGVPGFRKAIVSGIRIDGRPITFDHKLEVVAESPTTLYTDLVCDANGVCTMVGRKGDGSTKPQHVIPKTSKPR
ncbi:MAG: carboxypeptidase-like regulatory domain-containing protein [Pyrinomonadaceae bacterium]|nr:carboxypeptidase-like regulatory domain-containing protein [Pyrinomonadaceae bacterium]